MISVIIPTLNEKKNILVLAKKLIKLKIVYEIIFVDDNSTDGTFKEINKLRKNKKIRPFKRISKQRDLSKSVMYGVIKARKDMVLVMDCDLQHDTFYILSMWNKFLNTNTDIIIASRFEKKSLFGNLGFLRSLISKMAIFLINLLLGKKSTDPLSGFFLCRKKLITKYKKNFYLRGYKILFDILYNGQKNIRAYDYHIVFKKRKYEKSKFNLRIIKIFITQMLYTKLLVKK